VTNQADRLQAWATEASIAPGTYEETFLAAADSLGIGAGTYPERFVLYLQSITGSVLTDVNSLMAEVARLLSVSSWNEVGASIATLHTTLGAEIILNPDFDTDAANWTLGGAWLWNAGLVLKFSGAVPLIQTNASIANTTNYRIVVDAPVIGGTLLVSLNGATPVALSVGINSINQVSGSTGTTVTLSGDGATQVSSVSVKAIL
jgi:hypothetical protein